MCPTTLARPPLSSIDAITYQPLTPMHSAIDKIGAVNDWLWVPLQFDKEDSSIASEGGSDDKAHKLYARQAAAKEAQRAELERLGLNKGPMLGQQPGQQAPAVARNTTFGEVKVRERPKSRFQPSRRSATHEGTNATGFEIPSRAAPQAAAECPPESATQGNHVLVDQGEATKLLKLELGQEGGKFHLHVLHDPLDNVAATASHSTLFVMREVWLVLLGEGVVPKHQFKAQLTVNSKFLQDASQEVKKTDKGELCRLKQTLSEQVLGKRAREALLGGIEVVCAFLSHHGKSEIGSAIKLQLPSAVASAMMAPHSSKQHQGAHNGANEATVEVGGSNAHTTATTTQQDPNDIYHYGLSEPDTPLELAVTLKTVEAYWTGDIVPNREGVPVSLGTWGSRESRIRQFLGYCKLVHKLDPKLELCKRLNLWHLFFEWLRGRSIEREERRPEGKKMAVSGDLTASGGVQFCAAAIMICKWLEKDNPKKGRKFRHIEHIEKLRALLCQLRTTADKVKKLDKDSDPCWVEMEDLDAGRNKLAAKVSNVPASDASKKAKLQWAQDFQDYMLCMMWTRVPPVRSQVVRSLRLLPLQHQSKASRLSWDCKKGCYVMYFPHHKTGSTKRGAGYSDMVPFPTDMTVLINRYISEALPIKLAAANKPVDASFDSGIFLFLNTKGSFFCQPAFSAWVQKMWERSVGHSVKGHTIRKIMVTDLYNRPSSLQERLSWAATMGHSLRTQEEIYNLQTRTELVAPAIADMNQQIVARATTTALKLSTAQVSGSGNHLIVQNPTGQHKGVALSAMEGARVTYDIEGVVDVKANKRGSDVLEAQVQWAPSWVLAKHLTKPALDEARSMLPLKKKPKNQMCTS